MYSRTFATLALLLASVGLLILPGVARAQNSKFEGKAIALKLKDGKVSYPGEIADSDGMTFNRYFKLFTVELEKGKVYRIEQRDRGDDPKFDAYLFLEDAQGNQLEADDDSGGELNARIVFKAAKTGTYRIITTTLPVKQTGQFTLEISPANAEESKFADMRYRVRTFADASPAQRKNLVEQVSKYLKDRGEKLAISDFSLVNDLGAEVELEDVDLAKTLYKNAIDAFDESGIKQAKAVTRSLGMTLKNLDKIGKELEISGMTIDGKEFDLKKLKGKVVLVDFWGTWCGPCVAEMPNIVKAYKKYNPKGFEVIGVARDKSDEVVSKFMEARKLPWPCINIEDSLKLIKMYEVTSYPSPMLVDGEGRVVSLRARGPNLERLLERFLVKGKQ